MANLEWDVPNTPDAKFRLGSITKQFTATAISPTCRTEEAFHCKTLPANTSMAVRTPRRRS
jgi:hypothetical protein